MFLEFVILSSCILHYQGHHPFHVIPEPMSRLSAHSSQSLDVCPCTGSAARLGQLIQQHVDQLDVEGLVAGHDQVAEAENGAFSHCKPWTLELRRKGLHKTWVELD